MRLIPTSLITRATLDGVAQIYETGVLPNDPDTCVLWDAMQVAGCETLAPPVDEVEAGSALHRWIVLDAIESAESIPQDEKGRAAIGAAKAWVVDPSEENRVDAHDAPAYSAFAAAYSSYGAYAAFYAASPAYSASAARLRFRVLATMAAARVLPEPEVTA